MNVKIISAILVLALASLACGFSIDLPARQKAGPEVKESITVADPKSAETRLSLTFGAGKLTLSPGAKNLVDGTAVYNVKELKPEIQKNGSSIGIKQGDFHSLPAFCHSITSSRKRLTGGGSSSSDQASTSGIVTDGISGTKRKGTSDVTTDSGTMPTPAPAST